jgi:hypothetical protein
MKSPRTFILTCAAAFLPRWYCRWLLRNADGAEDGFWGIVNRKLTAEYGDDWRDWLPGAFR